MLRTKITTVSTVILEFQLSCKVWESLRKRNILKYSLLDAAGMWPGEEVQL